MVMVALIGRLPVPIESNSAPDRPKLCPLEIPYETLSPARLRFRLPCWRHCSGATKRFEEDPGDIKLQIDQDVEAEVNQHSFPDFDVAGIFRKLADEDYDKAVQLAGGFEREAPRSNAVIAIALSVLEEKKK